MNPIGSLGLGPVALEAGMGWVKGFHPRIRPGLALSHQPTQVAALVKTPQLLITATKKNTTLQTNDKVLCACAHH